MGVFHSHNTTTVAPVERQEPSNSAVPDPITFPLSKALEAACPVHDTHAAGVVTQANNHIAVALKIPHAPYKRCAKKFSGKVLTI